MASLRGGRRRCNRVEKNAPGEKRRVKPLLLVRCDAENKATIGNDRGLCTVLMMQFNYDRKNVTSDRLRAEEHLVLVVVSITIVSIAVHGKDGSVGNPWAFHRLPADDAGPNEESDIWVTSTY